MLAELAAANAAFSVIKNFVSNGKELASCGKQIGDFVFAKEQIEKKASKQKAKGGGGDLGRRPLFAAVGVAGEALGRRAVHGAVRGPGPAAELGALIVLERGL